MDDAQAACRFLRDVTYFSRFYVFYAMSHPLLCLAEASRLGHPLRTRSFEKRETEEKRGVHVKRERAWFLGEGCRGAVGKYSRSGLRGARDGTSVGAGTEHISDTLPQQTSGWRVATRISSDLSFQVMLFLS
jgi:hypothetical protein